MSGLETTGVIDSVNLMKLSVQVKKSFGNGLGKSKVLKTLQLPLTTFSNKLELPKLTTLVIPKEQLP